MIHNFSFFHFDKALPQIDLRYSWKIQIEYRPIRNSDEFLPLMKDRSSFSVANTLNLRTFMT